MPTKPDLPVLPDFSGIEEVDKGMLQDFHNSLQLWVSEYRDMVVLDTLVNTIWFYHTQPQLLRDNHKFYLRQCMYLLTALSIEYDLKLNSDTAIYLTECVLGQPNWRDFFALVNGEYFLAALLLSLDDSYDVMDIEYPSVLDILEEWGGVTFQPVHYSDYKAAFCEKLFGKTWTTLCRDMLTTNFVHNGRVLLSTKPVILNRVTPFAENSTPWVSPYLPDDVA